MSDSSDSRVAVLLMAHGGPHAIDDVAPMLHHIMKGRVPTPAVVAQITDRYRLIGGKSPLFEITTEQATALCRLLNQNEARFRVYVGMRHWTPFISDVVREIVSDSPSCLIAIPLAPHYSRMSVGAYIEALRQAWQDQSAPCLAVEGFCDHPLLIEAFAENVKAALAIYPEPLRSTIPVLFTAHSLPERILSEGDRYPDELNKTVSAIVKHLGLSAWRFAYQSRGISPGAWLGPDVEAVISEVAAQGIRHLVMAPIGFVADHVEILYDIDIHYHQIAKSKGVALTRTASLNTRPAFIEMLAALVHERLPASSS